MTNKPAFKQAQVDFAAHIRNPLTNKKPEQIEERRMDIYRTLFINSISGLLGGSFPVIRTLYNDRSWEDLVRQFYQKEHNKTPHFPEIPREFVEFLKQHDLDPQRPFLYELAHYEWIELHLEKHNLEINKTTGLDPIQLLQERPVISPLAKIQAYHFPVHQIKADHQPFEPSEQSEFMLIWRDTNYHVHFAKLNPFSALLLETLINNKLHTGQQILQDLATQNNHPNVNQFIEFGHQAMHKWFQQDIILATEK